MLKNYIKIAFRNLWKNKGFTFINFFGLALGVTAFLLITLYAVHELSFDRFHKKADRIYRINADINFGGKYKETAEVSDPLGFTLKNDYPIIENVVRFRRYGSRMIKRWGSNQNFDENAVIYADSTLFDVFTFPFIAGNPKTALREPNTLVITESTAIKYFNNTDVVGKVLVLNNSENYRITGIIEDIPDNSHFKFDFFLSMEGWGESKEGNFLKHNFNTYLLLKEGVDPKEVEKKFPQILTTYLGPQAKRKIGQNYQTLQAQGSFIRYTLMPLRKIHLYSNRQGELGANGNIQFVYVFSGIAFLVLIIACINFMNLSTARSANRAKEVGVRKVMGSYKSNLIAQFLTESLLLSFVAFLVATIAALFLLPLFNELAGKDIQLELQDILFMLPVLAVLTLITGILAGSYPAFYLSSFQPISVLKGKVATGVKSGWLRSSLVVFQFAMSTILIVGTLVIHNQMNYIQNKDLGYDKEQLLVVWGTFGLGSKEKVMTFKNEALKNPGVSSGTVSHFLPIPSARNSHVFFKEGSIGSNNNISLQRWEVDHDYLKTFGMKVLAGRDFDKNLATDSLSVIINESAAKLIGYNDPLNKYITRSNFENPNQIQKYRIIGVVQDFHFESLRDNVVPLCFILAPSPSAVTFKISSSSAKDVIASIENLYKTMAPDLPFNYSFVDEGFEQMYRAEQRTGKLLAIFAGFAIFIACLGLFGLVTYAAEQRTKEIGIRKVLGASLAHILTLLSQDFLKLVIVAFVLAVPISWWTMNEWLKEFAYKIEISWWLFAFAGGVAVLIALITISVQGVKAAVANPIKSLRTE